MPESGNSYSGKIKGALKKHKGKIATGIAECGLIEYINGARNVASNVLVEEGLNSGKGILTHPYRVAMLLTPHLENVRGNTPMDPTYVVDEVASFILKASKNPVAVAAALLIPPATYVGYRAAEHAYPVAEKNVDALSHKILPEFAYEKFRDINSNVKKKLRR